jgi:hypothetical protein
MAAAPQPEDWISSLARIIRASDREILAVIRSAYSDINKMLIALGKKSGIGSEVRADQLRAVRAALLRAHAEILKQAGQITESRRLEAAARATALSSAVDSVLFAAAGSTAGRVLAESFAATAASGLDAAIARLTGASVPLSYRVYRTEVWLNGRVEAKINSALARGLGAREFAAEARDWINPNTPGGVRYAALRLARTEINNAFHAISIESAQKPWVTGMKWNLSRSHRKADDCDRLARADNERMGAGVYSKGSVPRKPHPQCFCYVTPVVIGEDDFLDNLVAGNYDGFLRQRR